MTQLPWQLPELLPEVQFALLIFILFIVPRFFSRLLPTAITAFVFGGLFGIWFDVFSIQSIISLLSMLGIVSLFLFAGLDVEFEDIFKVKRTLFGYLALMTGLLVVTCFVAQSVLGLMVRPALVFSLALLTPSTGFILDSIATQRLNDQVKFWIRSKAIAFEILALLILFFTVQSTSWSNLGISSLVIVLMILLLPVLFHFFAKTIAPYAPDSEFGFLLILASFCAMLTKKLGAYYLIGAFVVGIAAHRFEQLLPNLVSERMLHSMRVFASFFIPFYFFGAGLSLSPTDFTIDALLLGLGLLVVVLPLRMAVLVGFRYIALKESLKESCAVALHTLPTLVFGLVLSGILKTQFDVDAQIFGALMVYTLGATLVPVFFKQLVAHNQPNA